MQSVHMTLNSAAVTLKLFNTEEKLFLKSYKALIVKYLKYHFLRTLYVLYTIFLVEYFLRCLILIYI